MFTHALNIKKTTSLLLSSIITLVLTLSLSSTSVKADDTEVFISSGNTANVLFIFDMSLSMEWTTDTCSAPHPWTSCYPTGSEQSRYDIMMDAFTSVLDDLKDKSNLRIGLSIFGVNSTATGIRWPVTSISAAANTIDSTIAATPHETHSIILKQLQDYDFANSNHTAISDSLYEALLYFNGGKVSDGIGAGEPPVWDGTSYTWGNIHSAHPGTYTPSTAWNSGTSTFSTSATYTSPINGTCDKNYIVLLSDGEPTISNYTSEIEALIGTCSSTGGGKCGPELVKYMNTHNLNAGGGVTPSKVKTHTIGFAVDGVGKTYLQTLATESEGDFFSASNAAQLKSSLEAILTIIQGENESFSALSTSTNASSLSSENRTFVNMFRPSDKRSWAGNTKGYFIGNTGLLDVNGVLAVETDGQFKNTAQSFWSSSIDGNSVDQGGLSGKLNPSTRKIFTYTGSKAAADIDNETLIDISSGDASLTATLFSAADDTEKNTLITWLKDAPMGDPLHSNSVKISYNATKDVLFTITNQGLLHIFDVTNPTTNGDLSGGTELSAFIPQSLLLNIKAHMTNETKADDHLYGLDSLLSYQHDDADGDGTVNNSEKVYLYFGMRRGGKQYFALDVTNTSAPKLAWRIDGGSGDFTELGQTWSRMIPTTINWNSANKNVLLFAGGYDVAVDGHPTRTTDSNNDPRSGDTVGNAVFMVDAETGDLLWSMHGTGTSNSIRIVDANLKYSIPSDLSVIDSDSDKLADRIYFGDMGGQVWRIDFTSSLGGSGGSYAYRIADLAGDDAANFRRFYMPPSVAILRSNGQVYFAVAIGSGFRAHPLQTGVQDRFYMIKDTNISNATSTPSWTLITDPSSTSADLYNVTANVIGQGTSTDADTNAAEREAAQTLLDNAKGWRLNLAGTGEKALTAPLIFNHVLVFPTYTPASGSLTCNGTSGSGNLYLINLSDATPYKDYTGDTKKTSEDRSYSVPGVGISPKANVYYAPPGSGDDVTLFPGRNPGDGFDMSINRINWQVIE